MQLEAAVSDLPRGWSGASHIIRPLRAHRGRPRARFRLVIDTVEDAREARRLGLPVFILTPEIVTALGYPIDFPPQLLVAHALDPVVDSPLPRILAADSEAARWPTLEDVVVSLLRVDALAARGIAARHRLSIDPVQLLRRVVLAESEAEATWVNLQEFAPSIPRVGPTIPPSQLEEQDRAVQVVGLRA